MSDIGHYEYLVAQRNRVLSTARMSSTARAQAMGRVLHRPVAKEHRIVVDIKADTKTIETMVMETPKVVAPPIYVTPKRHYLRSIYADLYNAVAETWGITVHALRSECRKQQLAQPRFALCRLLRERGLSMPAIGSVMKRDHTTCLHALRRAAELLENDKVWAARYHAAKRLLEPAQ